MIPQAVQIGALGSGGGYAFCRAPNTRHPTAAVAKPPKKTSVKRRGLFIAILLGAQTILRAARPWIPPPVLPTIIPSRVQGLDCFRIAWQTESDAAPCLVRVACLGD